MATSQSELESLVEMTRGRFEVTDFVAALVIDLREIYLRLSELDIRMRDIHAGWDEHDDWFNRSTRYNG